MKSMHLFFKTLALFFVGHLFINSHLFASKTLLEELGIDCPHQIITIPPKLEFKGGDFPTEIALSIFKQALSPHPGFLKLASNLNHEWNNWAYPKLLPYQKLYKAAEEVYFSENKKSNKDNFKRVALHFLFCSDQKLKSAPKETLSIQKIFRNIISKTVENNIFSGYQKEKDQWSDDPEIISVNSHIFHDPHYYNEDKQYNPIKLLRAWSELQRYKSGTYISHMLWETFCIFSTFLMHYPDGDDRYFREFNCGKYNNDDDSGALKSIYSYSTYIYEHTFDTTENHLIHDTPYSSITKLFYTARKHWKDYPDAKDLLSKIIFQTIDLDKHIMFWLDGIEREQQYYCDLDNFYKNCPDYKILTLFQRMPVNFESVDLIESYYKRKKSYMKLQSKNLDNEKSEEEIPEPNIEDLLEEKLSLLKESILIFAQQSLIPAEIYTKIVKRQLRLG